MNSRYKRSDHNRQLSLQLQGAEYLLVAHRQLQQGRLMHRLGGLERRYQQLPFRISL